jgi:DNA-binding transcriptional ArsR family regulator
MFEPKVTLDQASFRALASETRIAILRCLSERQMTLTEMAERLQISKPGVMKHLELLQEAGLVSRDPPERKWIYYRLTTKGERILDPTRTRIMLALGFSIFATILGGAAYVVVGGSTTFYSGTSGSMGTSSLLDSALALLPFVLIGLGVLATVGCLVALRRARVTDAEILSRLSQIMEESPTSAPTAGAPPS